MIPRTDGTPVVATLECPDCHAEWDAFGVMEDLGDREVFVPTDSGEQYCSCGTRGMVKSEHTIEPDHDMALETAWERGHFRE